MSLKSMGHWVAALAGVTMRSLERLAAAAALGLVAFGATDLVTAGTTFTGQFGTGNTWNLYESINTPFSFKEALAFAGTRMDPTGGSAVGHLVTLSSLEENDFVHTTGGGGDRWIGLTDRAGAAPGAMESALTADPLTMGWAWVTGEPFTFQNWNAGEPNNANAAEDAVHIGGNTFWNDNASGFGENDPPLEPPDFDSMAEPPTAFGFVIEWSTNLATQPTGFPMTRPDPGLPRVFPEPLARLPGPDGTASAFGVRDFLGLGASSSMRDGIAKILSGTATVVDGTATHFDIHDPDNGAAQGSIVGPQVPIPSDFVGGEDDNFQEVVKGTFVVPEGQGGAYTFNVRSDDGFAMRILSQASGGPLVQHKFTAARTGVADEDGTLTFLAPTGDSNTQGVINLGPGTYDVEFAWFENGGGAFAEVSTAKGDFVNAGGGVQRWLLLGDGSSLPQAGPFPQAARLTGTATVKNFNYDAVSNPAPASISDVIANFRTNPTLSGEGTADDVVLNGDNTAGIHGGTLADADMVHQFPNGTAVDHFSTQVTGQFEVVDTDGAAGETLTFGLFADDNAALHITGQNFTGVADFVADFDAALLTPSGESDTWLVADYRTGNTDAYGLITLPEGNYDFEAFQVEEGSGAALEVWAAAGDQLATGFAGGTFFPLTIDTMPDQVLAANQGLALVDGPGTGPAVVTGDYNGNGTVDAADYTVWRDTLGSTTDLAADGNGNNVVDADDYGVWKSNFGVTGGAGTALDSHGVPEPTTLWLGVIAVLSGFVATRGRRSRR